MELLILFGLIWLVGAIFGDKSGGSNSGSRPPSLHYQKPSYPSTDRRVGQPTPVKREDSKVAPDLEKREASVDFRDAVRRAISSIENGEQSNDSEKGVGGSAEFREAVRKAVLSIEREKQRSAPDGDKPEPSRSGSQPSSISYKKPSYPSAGGKDIFQSPGLRKTDKVAPKLKRSTESSADLLERIGREATEVLSLGKSGRKFIDLRGGMRPAEVRGNSPELSHEPFNDFRKAFLSPLRSWQEELGGGAILDAVCSPNIGEHIVDFLREKGVERLYHFTDRRNVDAIIRTGGLYSWAYLEKVGRDIPAPGGGELSRQLDRKKGLENYVRLSFVKDHPMMYRAKLDGRISDPVVLEIDIDVVRFPDVMFSDRNAVSNDASISPGIEGLRRIDFDLVSRGRWSSEDQKARLQAEVLVGELVPGYLVWHEGRLVRKK